MILVEKMDSPGIEPGAFCMQNRRDTTTLQTQLIINMKQLIIYYCSLPPIQLHTQ